MLTVMCPNCRHRFPAPGCCNPLPQATAATTTTTTATNAGIGAGGFMMQPSDVSINGGAFYGGGYLLVPREYNSNSNSNTGGCFINAPTIIHGPAIIQQPIDLLKAVDPRTTFVTEKNASWKIGNVDNHKETSNSAPTEENCINKSIDTNVQSIKSTKNNDEICTNGLNCHINTTCDLTGGTVTITTPSIQSGGCLIQSTESGILVQAPRIEIRPKLSGGGCFLEKRLSIEDQEAGNVVYRDKESRNDGENVLENNLSFDESSAFEKICLVPPSGCQELPGIRRCSTKSNQQRKNYNKCYNNNNNNNNNVNSKEMRSGESEIFENCRDQEIWRRQFSRDRNTESFCDSERKKRHSSCCCAGGSTIRESGEETCRPLSSSILSTSENSSKKVENSITNPLHSIDSSGGMEIRVNATVQLPSNVGHCTVNITATTGNSNNLENNRMGGNNGLRTRNNFNGGGLVQVDANVGNFVNDANQERRDDTPTTPVSWLMPCPWGFDNYPQEKDVTRLSEIKRLLHTSGWYHEGLSWQQSETLLKNAQLGSWLMRDSSDSRFVFAVSVQTARGATSVRVHYFFGKFRLDAEPRLSVSMPLFDCPIKMLQYYVDYSKRIDEHRKEVWVDYTGQLYSQIYLTKPLVKEVRSLSHLARLAVNKHKLSTDHLPPLIRNYIAEYPYSL